MLAALGKELDVSKSRDLGDYLTTLRNATPDPVTLLTHEDRMSQLDLESRGPCCNFKGDLRILYLFVIHNSWRKSLMKVSNTYRIFSLHVEFISL